MENKLKVFFLALIAIGVWVQVLQTGMRSSETQIVSVINTVDVNDVTPKSEDPIDVNIAAINGNKSAFVDQSGSPENGGFGSFGFGGKGYYYLPIYLSH